MSAIPDKVDVIGREPLLDDPVSHNKRSKKWHLAFATIYCSRTLFSLARNEVPPIPSHIALTIPPENSCFKIDDETTLTDPVKEKNQGDQRQKVPSHVAITIRAEENDFSEIDQATLTGLFKDKNLRELQIRGGVDGVASSLKTSLDGGINGSKDDISRRQRAFGFNTYNNLSFYPFVVEAFGDLTVLILLSCAALSLGFGIKGHGLREGWFEGGSIFVATFLVIAISAISNYRETRQFEEMSPISNNIEIDVMRDGQRKKIQTVDLVVGDIVCLKIGDIVPADGLFVPGSCLQVVESSMTGEDDHDEENSTQNRPFMVSGTRVANADARMLVTSVGMNTTLKQMMSEESDDNEQTPMQIKVKKLARSMRKIREIILVLLLVVNYFTNNAIDKNENKEDSSKKKAYNVVNAVEGIIASAAVIISVVVPESLPLIFKLTLAKAKERMKVVASAFDTVGSVSIIVTNKTGTLTLNQMKVKESWIGYESMGKVDSSASCLISSDVVELIHQEVALDVVDLIQQGVALNTNTTGGVYGSSSSGSEFEFEFSGSPTEKAILSWAFQGMKMDMKFLKQNFTILFAETFNSRKKRSGVLIKKKEDNTVHVHWKGEAEMILAMCSSYYDASGVMKDLNEEEMMEFKKIIQGMAASSLQCIAFAHKQVAETEEEDVKEKKKLNEENLTLLGLVGIQDQCQPGVKEAVEDCQYAGVNIKMITGDNVFTARAIATECGILRPGQDVDSGVVVEGEEFRSYTPEERMEKVDKICVMARSSPFDKFLMVQCLKRKGHVVAVTGDCTNDALALKEADIGLLMGIQGTEVAKESSNIVILDGKFASVATVLKWGRFVYTNIQKFIQFQLTVNVAAMVFNLVAAISAGEVPLTAIQLLWVNSIMFTFGALALATEKPTKELMEKPPVGRTEPLISNIMWRNLLAQALYQIVVLLTLQFRGESILGVTEAVNDTLIFNTFVLCQVFNEFNARKLEKKNVFKGIHKNKLFLGVVGMTIVLQVVMVEFLKQFAGTERLNWRQWGACIAMAAVSWPIDWIVKCMPVPERPVFSYF